LAVVIWHRVILEKLPIENEDQSNSEALLQRDIWVANQ